MIVVVVHDSYDEAGSVGTMVVFLGRGGNDLVVVEHGAYDEAGSVDTPMAFTVIRKFALELREFLFPYIPSIKQSIKDNSSLYVIRTSAYLDGTSFTIEDEISENIIVQHMDIEQPLTTLRALLSQVTLVLGLSFVIVASVLLLLLLLLLWC